MIGECSRQRDSRQVSNEGGDDGKDSSSERGGESNNKVGEKEDTSNKNKSIVPAPKKFGGAILLT